MLQTGKTKIPATQHNTNLGDLAGLALELLLGHGQARRLGLARLLGRHNNTRCIVQKTSISAKVPPLPKHLENETRHVHLVPRTSTVWSFTRPEYFWACTLNTLPFSREKVTPLLCTVYLDALRTICQRRSADISGNNNHQALRKIESGPQQNSPRKPLDCNSEKNVEIAIRAFCMGAVLMPACA
jgi:hypothetical protein